MRLTEHVNIPADVAEEHSAGRLALFVGAGVSVNGPSDLPLFGGLARLIGDMNGYAYDDAEPPDAFLGRLQDRGAEVKKQTQSIIASPTSRPNRLLRAIARLTDSSPRINVVTTNYDEHIHAAAVANHLDLGDRYTAPAVPLGRDFSGVVYLHGAVTRPPRELVLTDEDFGRAYLTEGWARRFVQDLFLTRPCCSSGTAITTS